MTDRFTIEIVPSPVYEIELPERGPQGLQGPKGDTGATGPTGPAGPQGPQGEKGDIGPQGIQGVQGPKGDKGDSALTFAVGTTVELPTSNSAYVENVGTNQDIVLNFGIPRGLTGPTGATGPQGPKGDVGPIGPQGPKGETGGIGPIGPQGPKGDSAFTLSIGEVKSVNYNEPATVTNVGTETDQIWDMSIPRGRDGGGEWGSITGDITSQSDLIEKFETKQDKGNYVSYVSNTVTVAGTDKIVAKVSPVALYVPDGLVMGGTALSAGLVTRGICGSNTPTTNGTAIKENLYLNYDGNDTNNPNGRGVIINAGTPGANLGNGMYSFCATRGDVVKEWVENNTIQVETDPIYTADKPNIAKNDLSNLTEEGKSTLKQISQEELNNPFSLFDSKYSDHELNNLSWLKSEGQWNAKAVYMDAYDKLLKVYNGTETVEGLSVKLSTEDYTDYDFILNTANETFRLPLKTKLASGKAVVGNGITLGLTNGNQTAGLTQDSNNNTGIRTNAYGLNVGSAYNAGTPTTLVTYGVTTDPDKSGIETSDIGLYLYYYVGETVQNANLIDAGRIGEKLADCITRTDCKAYITETYVNGTSWYRIYSDGWCEQGGEIISNASVQTISLLKAYVDKYYTLTMALRGNYTDNWSPSSAMIGEYISGSAIGHYSNSQFQFLGAGERISADWRACGYIN